MESVSKSWYCSITVVILRGMQTTFLLVTADVAGTTVQTILYKVQDSHAVIRIPMSHDGSRAHYS